MKYYHYFVSYDIFGEAEEVKGKGNAGCWTTDKIDSMEDIKIMEKRLNEKQKEGDRVLINNFRLLMIDYNYAKGEENEHSRNNETN